MKIIIAAVGKAKPGPERALFEEYLRRLPWKVTLRECEAPRDLPPEKRKAREAELLLAAAKGAERIVALDERGKALASREFAGEIATWQSNGVSSLAFVIGGADGLAPEVLKGAALSLSFGRLSWPHMLVRPMLAEQLYRAHTLLSGHPYHRD